MVLFSGATVLMSNLFAISWLSPILQEPDNNYTLIPLLVLLVLLGLVFLVIWLFQRTTVNDEEPEDHARKGTAYVGTAAMPVEDQSESNAQAGEEASEVEEEMVDSAPPEADDLQRIEGIGPKISSLLRDNGITTFEQLANTDVSTLQKILEDANLRIANPETWPQQAKLAQDLDWEGLNKFQDSLKGG